MSEFKASQRQDSIDATKMLQASAKNKLNEMPDEELMLQKTTAELRVGSGSFTNQRFVTDIVLSKTHSGLWESCYLWYSLDEINEEFQRRQNETHENK